MSKLKITHHLLVNTALEIFIGRYPEVLLQGVSGTFLYRRLGTGSDARWVLQDGVGTVPRYAVLANPILEEQVQEVYRRVSAAHISTGGATWVEGSPPVRYFVAVCGDGLTTLFSSDVPVGRRGPVEKLLRHTVASAAQRDQQARRGTYAGLQALEGKSWIVTTTPPNPAYANALAVAAKRLIQSARKLLKLLTGAQT